ncbi:MAG: hypothetical protein J6A15_07295 [Clostridia bacterium]|nr:hypothetical protein [Clostridia bacterium]
MFDMFFGRSYIKTTDYEVFYLEESYDTLKRLINDENSNITVTVMDPITGFLSDKKTIQKSKIKEYGQN